MQLVDLPRNIGIAPYDRARERVKRLYADLPGVSQVLEFGTIPYPGISDMDFFIVTKPGALVEIPRFSAYEEDERYAMCHRHYLLAPRALLDLDFIDPWFTGFMPLLSGRPEVEYTKRTFSPEGYGALSLNFIHQKLTYGSLHMLASTLSTGELAVRHFFEEFKLFQYFLREFRKVGAPLLESDPSLERYTETAKQWFSYDHAAQVAVMEDVFRRYQSSVLSAYRMLRAAVKGKAVTKDASPYAPRTEAERAFLKRYPHSLVIDLFDHVYVYREGVTTITVEEDEASRSLPLIGTGRRFVHTLPYDLACFATPHLFLTGPVSDHFKTRVFTDLPTLPLLDDPDLLHLHEVDNMNLRDTRNVRNGKYYEMLHSYVPRPDLFPSLASRLKSSVSRFTQSLARRVSDSSVRERLSSTRTLFSAEL